MQIALVRLPPNKESGLAVGPWSIACDAACRAFNQFGIVLDNIFLAGNAARLLRFLGRWTAPVEA